MSDKKFRFKDTDLCRKKLKEMADLVVEMENNFDWSMEGVWLDVFVTNYAAIKGKKLIEFFEYIMEHQKENDDNYGDIDTSITKLKCSGSLHDWQYWSKDYDFTATGIYLQDNPTCANENKWVIIKVVKKHKLTPGKEEEGLTPEFWDTFTKVYYHVRVVNKKMVNVDISKVMKYGDFRDENYVVTLEKDKYDKEFKIKDDRGMLYFYKKMEHVIRNLHTAYFELKRDKE